MNSSTAWASSTKHKPRSTSKLGQRRLPPEEEEEGRGQGREAALRKPVWELEAHRHGSNEKQREEGGRRRTHRGGTVTGVGVVLDFPQPLVEAFPLVWFPIFVFVFLIREEIFRAQEGAGEKQSRGEAGAAAGAQPRAGSEAALTSRGCRRRRWGTCSGGVSRRRPRCHRSERKPKAGGGQREQPELVPSQASTDTRDLYKSNRRDPRG